MGLATLIPFQMSATSLDLLPNMDMVEDEPGPKFLKYTLPSVRRISDRACICPKPPSSGIESASVPIKCPASIDSSSIHTVVSGFWAGNIDGRKAATMKNKK